MVAYIYIHTCRLAYFTLLYSTLLCVLLNSDEGRQLLFHTFGICKPLNASDAGQWVKDWLTNTWSVMPMVDYPSPASFLDPLPAWPLKVITLALLYSFL